MIVSVDTVKGTMVYKRYALYFVPNDGPLARFGTHWLGWDPVSGVETPQLETQFSLSEITQNPRRYGLHGTLHWPFQLMQPNEASVEQLVQLLSDVCARHAPIAFEQLELVRLGRFLALIPTGDQSTLRILAATLVREMAGFRAPPSEAELARRSSDHLSAEQKEMLYKWGYPYVMDQFRFHITLTNKLPKARLPEIEAELTTMLTTIKSNPFIIDSISVMGEDANGFFHVVNRIPLTGFA